MCNAARIIIKIKYLIECDRLGRGSLCIIMSFMEARDTRYANFARANDRLSEVLRGSRVENAAAKI